MKLRRLRIAQLRQFRQPLDINDLASGINVFTGPNESGKSTVVRAIRAAFFERYKSSSVDDLLPWGDSSAAPSIELEFDWQGERWKLTKSFLKTKRCDLEIAGRTISGDDAENRLAELFGYQFSGRGASKAEHWGIPGLLWIDQGTGQEIQAPVAHAANYLKSALGESLGEVASTAGDELMTHVAHERKALLTATGRATGQYAETESLYSKSQTELAELDDAIVTYRQQVDRLGELRQQQQEDDTRPWQAYLGQARQAQARLDEVQSWEQTQQREEKELHDCESNQTLCREQLTTYARQQDDLTQRARHKQQTEDVLHNLQLRQPQTQTQLDQAKAAYQQAGYSLKLARQHQQRATLIRERNQLKQELADIDDKLAQSRTLQAHLLAQRSQLQANQVDAAAIKHLQKIVQELNDLDIAKQHVATRLQFDLQSAQQLDLGGEVLIGQGQRLLLEPVTVDIPGIGQLRIQPGGEDIADLARRQNEAQSDLADLLHELRADSPDQAQAHAEQRRTLQEDIERGDFQLKNLAPDGVDELSNRQTLCKQRQQALQAELATLPEPVATDIDVATAESRLDAANEQFRTAEKASADFHTQLRLADQAVTSTTAEWQRLQQTVQAPDRQERERALNEQLVNLRAAEASLKESLARRQQQIRDANPDLLRQDIERYTRSATAREDEAQKRKLELAGLQSRLEALGANGLEERRATLAREFEFISRRRDELSRRAAALDLLLTLLTAKRQALTRRIQAPLQRHLNHYLQLLFTQASLSVNEDLIPEQLIRTAGANTGGNADSSGSGSGSGSGQVYDDFARLSFGAREQMGLISRLAYADLLAEAGRPTLIILDDALVHSDPQRQVQMKRILFDAALRHQILLFTCHPENWRDLGVSAIEMESLKNPIVQ